MERSDYGLTKEATFSVQGMLGGNCPSILAQTQMRAGITRASSFPFFKSQAPVSSQGPSCRSPRRGRAWRVDHPLSFPRVKHHFQAEVHLAAAPDAGGRDAWIILPVFQESSTTFKPRSILPQPPTRAGVTHGSSVMFYKSRAPISSRGPSSERWREGEGRVRGRWAVSEGVLTAIALQRCVFTEKNT